MNGAEARPLGPDVEVHERQQVSRRRHPWRGGGGDAAASPGPVTVQKRVETRDSSLSDTPSLFESGGCPP
ncbi:hypothetical protein NDU88_009303 [Pleurodeles waltl]|uniref:Uncharacterized protein n=1 Tax=Pleurodeles waltl TaxID=8319 RepID=A0AAV7PUU1_PLEWA|nr:hypothetical protein NDU88_009303 [Pleurodeles waltl]